MIDRNAMAQKMNTKRLLMYFKSLRQGQFGTAWREAPCGYWEKHLKFVKELLDEREHVPK